MTKRRYHETSKSWKLRKKRERKKQASIRFRRKMRKPAFRLKVMTRMTHAVVNAQPLKEYGFLASSISTKMRESKFENFTWCSAPALTLQAHVRGYRITDPG